jgi:hypothetical protein
MADKLLISISAQCATVAHWRGKVEDCREFPNDPDGHTAFKEHITQFSNVPVHILVDAVEEDYRFETLPHAFGKDRSDLVRRKLKQHYRTSPYVAAWLLGREVDKRRDDRYLFSALTNPDLIDEWVQAVATHGLPVAGIYLLPMVSGALLDKVETKASNLLLVAQHANGLRLSFFRDRQFRLSRLTRSDSGRADNRARYFSEEISNTRLYLHALRTMTLDEQLTVLLIDRTDELAEVAATVARDNASLDCVRLARHDLITRFGVPALQLDASPYAIYLQLLGMKEPPSNVASANITAGYKRYQARRTVYAACGTLAAAAAMWSGVNYYQIADLRGETEDAAHQTSAYSARYTEVTRQFPQTPTTAENLKKTVEIVQKLRQTAHTPQRMLGIVSEALSISPTVVVQEFGWKYGTTEIDSQGSKATLNTGAPTVTINTPGGTARKESASINGEIRPFRGDYRSAIVTINALAERISQDPAVAEVRVTKLPLNVNPALSLSGNTLDNPEQSVTAKAEFKLLVVLKPTT